MKLPQSSFGGFPYLYLLVYTDIQVFYDQLTHLEDHSTSESTVLSPKALTVSYTLALNDIKHKIWIIAIQLKWAFHNQHISSSRPPLCAGVCNREALLSPLALTAPRRDFPFLEIRIRAILSLTEHRRTALTLCLWGCLFVLYCFSLYVRAQKISCI